VHAHTFFKVSFAYFRNLHVRIIQFAKLCYYSPYFLNKNKTKHNDPEITSDVSSHVGNHFLFHTHCNIAF